MADTGQRAQRGLCPFGGFAGCGLGVVPEIFGHRSNGADRNHRRQIAFDCCGKVHRLRLQIAGDNGTYQTQFQRLCSFDRFAACHHLHGRCGTDQARGANGAASTGNEARCYLGQAHLRCFQHHAKAASKGNFQPAPKRTAMYGRDPWLLRRFDPGDQIGQVLRDGRLAKSGHIGPGDEDAPRTDQHHGVDRTVGIQPHHRAPQRLAQGLPKGIDGRVVDGDHGDGTVARDGKALPKAFCV